MYDNALLMPMLQLIAEALNALLHGDNFCSIDGNVTLIGRVASLHLVYQQNQVQVMWFGLLTAHSPRSMLNIRIEEVREKSEMVCCISVCHCVTVLFLNCWVPF